MHCLLYHGLYVCLFSSKTYWCRVSSQTFQVSRFWFIFPGLPVNKTKSTSYHKLLKFPGFFTFISRFFAIRLLFCISPNFLYWKTRIESPVIRYRFWIGFLFISDRKFWQWNHFQNGVEKCTRRFTEFVWTTCIPFIYIWTVEQRFS